MSILQPQVDTLRRDEQSGAVLETDNAALIAYKKRREQKVEYQRVCTDINNIKDELTEIKTLLKQALG